VGAEGPRRDAEAREQSTEEKEWACHSYRHTL
jgi:hypothetical protein